MERVGDIVLTHKRFHAAMFELADIWTPEISAVQLISHLLPCMTEIYLHIVARMAD